MKDSKEIIAAKVNYIQELYLNCKKEYDACIERLYVQEITDMLINDIDKLSYFGDMLDVIQWLSERDVEEYDILTKDHFISLSKLKTPLLDLYIHQYGADFSDNTEVLCNCIYDLADSIENKGE